MKVQIYDLKSMVDFSTSIVRKIAHRVLYKTCSYLSVGCTRISDEMRKARTDGMNIYLEKPSLIGQLCFLIATLFLAESCPRD